MKQFDFQSRYTKQLSQVGLVLAVLAFGGLGAHYLGISSAATPSYNHNPQGAADSCQLVGTTTVIYGWAADADAPVGNYPYVRVGLNGGVSDVPSNVSGYRDADINNYINTTNPGAPTSSEYGWTLSMNNLHRGTKYVLAGTMLNYGAGANVALGINHSHYVDNDTSKPYFNTDNSIPDACLNPLPVVATPTPAPAPAPAPTPAPVVTPAPKPTGTVSKSPTATTPTASTPAATSSGISNAADATVATGTTSANFSIPAGNASTAYILYGTSADSLNRSSDIQTITGTGTTANLRGLEAKTTYSYQIVRANSNNTVNSSTATFTTEGYTINLLFTNTNRKPVSGIKAQLGTSKVVSGSDGKVTFVNLPSGAYSPTFSYAGQTYSQDFNTSSAPTETGTEAIELSQAINVDNLADHKTSATPVIKKGSILPTILIIFFVLLLIGGGIFFWLRRRKQDYDSLPPLADAAKPVVVNDNSFRQAVSPLPIPTPQPPAAQSQMQPTYPPGVPSNVIQPVQVQQNPEHMGESLRDMVLQSMADEAAHHPHQGPKPPIVPGQQ